MHTPSSLRPTERGGIAILVVLVLLSVMTVAALTVGSNSFREIAITGNESTGRKAGEAADAGMDWVIAWANPDALGVATGGAEKSLQTAMGALLDSIGAGVSASNTKPSDPLPSDSFQANYTGYGLLNSSTGSLRVFMRSGDTDYAVPGGLHLSKKGDTGFKQDSVVEQAFDLEVRYLGVSMTNTGSGTKAKKQGNLFLVRDLGRATIGTTGQSFIAQREALVDYTPQ